MNVWCTTVAAIALQVQPVPAAARESPKVLEVSGSLPERPATVYYLDLSVLPEIGLTASGVEHQLESALKNVGWRVVSEFFATHAAGVRAGILHVRVRSVAETQTGRAAVETTLRVEQPDKSGVWEAFQMKLTTADELQVTAEAELESLLVQLQANVKPRPRPTAESR